MATKLFKSLILGAPASGKGTISGRIVNTFNLEHVSSGDKLRQNIQNKTRKFKALSNAVLFNYILVQQLAWKPKNT